MRAGSLSFGFLAFRSVKSDTVTRDAITDHIRTGASKVTRSQRVKDSSNVALRPQKPEGLLGTGPGQPPRLSRAKDDHPAVLRGSVTGSVCRQRSIRQAHVSRMYLLLFILFSLFSHFAIFCVAFFTLSLTAVPRGEFHQRITRIFLFLSESLC